MVHPLSLSTITVQSADGFIHRVSQAYNVDERQERFENDTLSYSGTPHVSVLEHDCYVNTQGELFCSF